MSSKITIQTVVKIHESRFTNELPGSTVNHLPWLCAQSFPVQGGVIFVNNISVNNVCQAAANSYFRYRLISRLFCQLFCL